MYINKVGRKEKIFHLTYFFLHFKIWDLIASSGLMHETSAQGWYTRMTQKDGMGRKVGGGLRMGNTNQWLIHINVWQKPLQYCKVISLQLI